jgi:pimeloyl-ACP methyl ester carboxylesterase
MKNNPSYRALTLARFFFGTLLILKSTTPALADEVTIKHQGLTLNGELRVADNRGLSLGAVLLVHGHLQHNRMEIIESTQNLLFENGINSLAINLSYGIDNRHGQYDCMSPHRYTYAGLISEIVAWVDWLEPRTKSIVLLGHSLAANWVMAATTQANNTLINGVVLMAPNTSGYAIQTSAYETRYKVSLPPLLTKAKNLVDEGKGEHLLELDVLLCPRTKVSAASFYDFFRDNPVRNDLIRFLQQSAAPVLVVAASADERQPNVAAYVRGAVDGQRIRLFVVENAGHFFRDLNLEDAIDEIVPFIEEVANRPD